MPFNVMYHTSTYPPAFVLLFYIFEQRLTAPVVLSFIDQQALPAGDGVVSWLAADEYVVWL